MFEPQQACRALLTDESRERILLAKRAPDDYAGGMWSAFGGKLDDGETPKEAVARETLEESGLVLHDIEFFDEHLESGWHTRFFTARATGEIILKLDEHTETRYFKEDELTDLELAFDHREFFISFLRSLRQGVKSLEVGSRNRVESL